jgi:hypothetical protein
LDAGKSGAAAKNLLGVYEIADDGTIGKVSLVFADTSGSVNLQEDITNVTDGAQLGFFLVANGAGLVTAPDADTFTFSGAGATANISDGANLDLLLNGTVVTNNVFHSFSPDLNGDGIQHAVSGTADNGITISFEDLWGGGDRDYQDVVVSVELFNFVPV